MSQGGRGGAERWLLGHPEEPGQAAGRPGAGSGAPAGRTRPAQRIGEVRRTRGREVAGRVRGGGGEAGRSSDRRERRGGGVPGRRSVVRWRGNESAATAGCRRRRCG